MTSNENTGNDHTREQVWEFARDLNGIPYLINHTNQSTQWDISTVSSIESTHASTSIPEAHAVEPHNTATAPPLLPPSYNEQEQVSYQTPGAYLYIDNGSIGDRFPTVQHTHPNQMRRGTGRLHQRFHRNGSMATIRTVLTTICQILCFIVTCVVLAFVFILFFDALSRVVVDSVEQERNPSFTVGFC